MNFSQSIFCFLIGLLFTSVSDVAAADSAHDEDRTRYLAPKAAQPLTIDGVADETVWHDARWQDLKHRWLGPEYTADDFEGRYKVVWTADKLYILG